MHCTESSFTTHRMHQLCNYQPHLPLPDGLLLSLCSGISRRRLSNDGSWGSIIPLASRLGYRLIPFAASESLCLFSPEFCFYVMKPMEVQCGEMLPLVLIAFWGSHITVSWLVLFVLLVLLQPLTLEVGEKPVQNHLIADRSYVW